MKIKGLKPTLVPSVPKILENKIEFRTTTNLEEYDAKLFTYALMKLEEQILAEHLDLDNVPKAFAIFTEDGEIEISLPEGVLGVNTHLLIYTVQRWKSYNITEPFKVSVFLEEMCHWLWNIEDETEVKYKIFEILKNIYPNIEFKEIYNIEPEI
ncbi:MAG: hypothetical protein Q8936_06720 [Bacillota bacterium]|nr:hypothetical protein [Bacillota bacterium]